MISHAYDANTNRSINGAAPPTLVTYQDNRTLTSYPQQLGAKRIDSGCEHALGLDAGLARRIESQQVHDDVSLLLEIFQPEVVVTMQNL